MCSVAAMQSSRKDGRLPTRNIPITKAQTFSCGIFGVCSPFLLSPRTPPFRVPNNSQEFSASDILLIQAQSSEESCEPSQTSYGPSELPNFYSLNVLTSASADSSAPLSPLQENSTTRPEFTEVDLGRRSPPRDLSDRQCIEILLTRIRKGLCSKSGLETLFRLVKESNCANIPALEEQMAAALISLLTSTSYDQCFKHTEPYLEAFGAVVRLLHNDAILQLCANPDMLEVLEWILNRGSLDARANAAILLQKISANEALEKSVRNRPNLLEGIVGLMLKREQPSATKLATRTLLSLCLTTENRCDAVRAGSVSAIVKILPGANVTTAEKALAILELLATTIEGRTCMIEHELLVQVLVGMILKVSDRATEYAAGALCAICTPDAPEIQERAVQAGAQTRLLLLLQSQCTSRAKRKALQLLKTLHKFWEREPLNVESGQTEAIHY